MLHVFGHKNPDSDSICTALVTADWLNRQGRPAQAYALGEPIAETRFILETAGVAAPPVLTGSVANKPVFLVDFSELEQGPEGLAEADVQGLIDHHRIGTLITRGPLDAWIRAVGCSATVLLELMGHDNLSRAQARLLLGAIISELEQGPEGLAEADVQGLIDHHRIGTLITRGPLDAWVRAVGCSATVLLELMGHDNLSRAQARLLLGAIISDTFNFTSPTTTAEDRLAVDRLLPIADLALAPFAQTLLERRTQLGDTPLRELLVADEKAYQIAGHSLMVSQICVMDPSQVHSRMEELHQAMDARLTMDSLDGYVLMLTDLAKGSSELHFASRGILPAEPVQLAGALSRKKEGLPWLTQQLSKVPR